MFDKEKLLSHLHEDEERFLADKALDKVELVLNRHKKQATNFLNPYQRKIIKDIIVQISDINFREEGGYNKAERKRINIFPDYLFPDHVPYTIKILKIQGNFSFQRVQHRDFLGALLSLGIKREMIGDILVLKNFAQIIVAEEIKSFVVHNLKTVHEVPVEITEIKREDIILPVDKSKDIKATVPSYRLDAVASAGFGDSRSKISREIENEKVKLNWKPENNPAAEVKVGDLISIKGRGRVKIVAENGLSNRGRIKLLLKRFT